MSFKNLPVEIIFSPGHLREEPNPSWSLMEGHNTGVLSYGSAGPGARQLGAHPAPLLGAELEPFHQYR